jgi:hypothetical protein
VKAFKGSLGFQFLLPSPILTPILLKMLSDVHVPALLASEIAFSVFLVIALMIGTTVFPRLLSPVLKIGEATFAVFLVPALSGGATTFSLLRRHVLYEFSHHQVPCGYASPGQFVL